MNDDWQPIETAPKDGTALLLFGQWEDAEIGRKTEGIGAGFYDSRGEWWSLISEDTCTPSHWLPLPKPPHGFSCT